MDEDNSNLAPNRPFRMRRPSSSLISSTTSPMFSAPPIPSLQPPPSPMAHHSRHRSINNNTNSNNNSGAISHQQNSNNNYGPGDIDDDIQPSSSSSPFPPPPSPRPGRMGGGSSYSRSSAASQQQQQSIQGPQSPLSSPDSTFWGGAAPSPSPATPYRGGPSTPGGMCVVSSSTIDDVPPSPFSPAEESIINHHQIVGGVGNSSSSSNSSSNLNNVNNLLSNNSLLMGPGSGPSQQQQQQSSISSNLNSGSNNSHPSNSGGNIVANNNGSLLVHNRISQLIGGGGSGGHNSSQQHQQHSALISQLNQDSGNVDNNISLQHLTAPSASSSRGTTSSSSSLNSSLAYTFNNSSINNSSSNSSLRNKIKKASSFERFSQQAQAASLSASGGVGSGSTSRSTGSSSNTGMSAAAIISGEANTIPSGVSRGSSSNVAASGSPSSHEIISNNNNIINGDNGNNGNFNSIQPISLPMAVSTSASSVVSRASNWEPAGSTSSASSASRLGQNSINFAGSDKTHIKIPSKKLAAKIASVFEQEQLNEAAANAAAVATKVIIQPTKGGVPSTGPNLVQHQQQQASIVQSYLNNTPAAQSSPISLNQNNSYTNVSPLNQILNEGPASQQIPGMGGVFIMEEHRNNSHHQQQVNSHENLIRELSESPLNLAETNSGSNNSNSVPHGVSAQPHRNPVIASSRASTSTSSITHNNQQTSSTFSSTSSSTSTTSSLLSKKIPLTPKQKLLQRLQSGSISPPPQSDPPVLQQQQLQQQQQQHVAISIQQQLDQSSPSPPQTVVQQLSQQFQQASISASLQSSMQPSTSAGLQPSNLSLDHLGGGSGGSSGNSANSHLILPHSPNSQFDAYSYEALMQRARDDLAVQEAIGKIIEDPSNVHGIQYDTPETYAYYQSILTDDEIFAANTQQSVAQTISSRGGTLQSQMQGGLQDDGLQQQPQQHTGGQIEFVLGLSGPDDHDRGGSSARADDLSLGGTDTNGGQQHFLDPNDALVTIKSHSQTESTLRNLLMMDSNRHLVAQTPEDNAWLIAEYQNRLLSADLISSRTSSSTSSSSIRNGIVGNASSNSSGSTLPSSVLSINGLPTSIATIGSWNSDTSWQRNPLAWQHQSGGPVDQDEVMDMSIIETDKGNSNLESGQTNNLIISKRLSQLHSAAYGDQGPGIDEVNLVSDRDLAHGLPLLQNMPISMPMDLQQPLGLLQSTSSSSGNSLKNAFITTSNGMPIDFQHHKLLSVTSNGSNMDIDDQPVNLMSAAQLEEELTHHHSSSNPAGHHNHSSAHLLPHHLAEVKSLSHSSPGSGGNNTGGDNSSQQTIGGSSYTLQIHPQHIPSDFHHTSSQQHLVEVNNLSPALDNIDERRVIRVKKNISFLQQEEVPSGLPQPNIIMDKPVQPKSRASLPSPLQLIQIGDGEDDWAVFTRNKTIPPNTRFGPVEGSLKKACATDMDTMNAVYPSLIVTDHHNNVLWVVNRDDDDCCNWMKFVRMAHSIKDQNALVSEGETDGHLYFTTCKEILPRTELQVGFSFEYAQKYGLPYLLPMPSSTGNPTNNGSITAAPSPGIQVDGNKMIISNLQQQPPVSVPSSVIHGSQNYFQSRFDDDNDPVIISNQHSACHLPLTAATATTLQSSVSLSPNPSTNVLHHQQQQPTPPPPVTQSQPQQKSVIVESYQCFECEQEFPDVIQLQEHLDKIHKEPEIRRPKKKAIKKYLQQQNSAVSTTNNNGMVNSSEVMDVSFSFSVESNNQKNQLQNQSGKVDSSSGNNAIDSNSDSNSMCNLPMTKKRKAASTMKAMSSSAASAVIDEVPSFNSMENSTNTSISGSHPAGVVQHINSDLKQDLTSSILDTENKVECGDVESMTVSNAIQANSIGVSDRCVKEIQSDENICGGSTGNENDVTTGQVPAKVKCTMCYKSFATKERLDRHMIVHSDEDTKPLKCDFCPKRFLTNSALAGHIKTHAEEGKCFECPICNFSTQQLLQLKEHVQTHKSRDSGLFHCPQCPKKFSAYSMIRKHIRAFHGPRQFECEQCPMSFPTSDKLKLHKLKHSDHREFLCAECGRQFKRKDKLREHAKRIHESKRKIVELSLPKDKSIKKFLPKISPEEYERFIYKCSECMVGFKRRGMLVNHLAKRHPEKPPQQVAELNLPIVRPARNYFCLYCERVYKSSSKRKAHIIKAHPGKPVPPQARSKDIPQQLTSFMDPLPLQPGTIVQTLTDDGNNTVRAGVVSSAVTSSRLSSGNVSTSSIAAAARREAIVGKVVAQPHGCQWCHRQYATRAKLLQHQRKAHIHLMPPDMQTPRTQKNNVAKKEEEKSKKSKVSIIKQEEQDSVISSNIKTEKGLTKIIPNTTSFGTVSTTGVLVSSQSGSSNVLSSTSGGAASATLQALQTEGLPFQTEDGGLVGILVTQVGSNVELGNLVQGDVPIVMLTTAQGVSGISASATQAALSAALQGGNFSVLQGGQVTSNPSPNNIISISSSTSASTSNNSLGQSSSNNNSSNNNCSSSSSSSTVTSRTANVIQHHQSSSGVISTTGKM